MGTIHHSQVELHLGEPILSDAHALERIKGVKDERDTYRTEAHGYRQAAAGKPPHEAVKLLQQATELEATNRILKTERTALITLLTQIEWVFDDRYQEPFCPSCHGKRDHGGHKAGCAIQVTLLKT